MEICLCVCAGVCIPLRYKRKKCQRKCDLSRKETSAAEYSNTTAYVYVTALLL